MRSHSVEGICETALEGTGGRGSGVAWLAIVALRIHIADVTITICGRDALLDDILISRAIH